MLTSKMQVAVSVLLSRRAPSMPSLQLEEQQTSTSQHSMQLHRKRSCRQATTLPPAKRRLIPSATLSPIQQGGLTWY